MQALELHGKLFPECNSLFSEEDTQVIFTTPGYKTLLLFNSLKNLTYFAIFFFHYEIVNEQTLVHLNGGDIGIGYIHSAALTRDYSDLLSLIGAFLETGLQSREKVQSFL